MLATCNMMIFFSCPVTALKEKDEKKWRIGGKEWLYAAGARCLWAYIRGARCSWLHIVGAQFSLSGYW